LEGVGKVKQTKKSSPPKVQLKNGTIFDMDTRKYIQNILKYKFKTIGPYI
jgi:hypothetical protein